MHRPYTPHTTTSWGPLGCRQQPLPADQTHTMSSPIPFPNAPDSLYGSSASSSVIFGASPDTPLLPHLSNRGNSKQQVLVSSGGGFIGAAAGGGVAAVLSGGVHGSACARAGADVPAVAACGDLLHVSLPVLLGCCEMLGHAMEDRTSVCRQQDVEMLHQLQSVTTSPLRDPSQRPLFVVAPLDVLVTRDAEGHNQFSIIEINGTGISGLTNMTDDAVRAVLSSFMEAPSSLPQQDCLVLVASSGQETYPPISRTLHEKMLYVEALKRGFEATGRSCTITNMTRLDKRPDSMPRQGVTIVLGYMKQFRASFMMDAPTGQLMLHGRQVHAAINDRFVLNIFHQFQKQLDLSELRAMNAGFTAGADKGVAYELYNQFFGSEEGGHFHVMAPCMDFTRAATRDDLISSIQARLTDGRGPVVIKPQGTGCGHGIEFFFAPQTDAEIAVKVDRALQTVASNYNYQCGGLPYTVCQYLDTATIQSLSFQHAMDGHKFEIRVVVYREGDQLKAFPSIAKVAREAFDPTNPDNRRSLLNNITTSAKETASAGSEHMLPLANASTLALLGISIAELTELCAASTRFIRFTLDQVQDHPEAMGLPPRAEL